MTQPDDLPAENPYAAPQVPTEDLHRVRRKKDVVAAVVLLVALLVGLIAYYLATGFGTAAEQVWRLQQRAQLADGIAFLVEAVLLGPTVAGPVVIWYRRGSLWRKPVLSGANVWIILAVCLAPQLALFLLSFQSFSPLLAMITFATWGLGIPIRGLVALVLTVGVIGRMAWPSECDGLAVAPWLDRVGVGLGLAWSSVSGYQIWSFITFGLPV